MGWLIAFVTIMVVINLAVLFLIYMSGNMPWGPRGFRRRHLRDAILAYRRRTGTSSSDKPEDLALVWSQIRMPFRRKIALIAAGIPIDQVRNPEVKKLSLDELQVLRALVSQNTP
jgi:hypothetical protein